MRYFALPALLFLLALPAAAAPGPKLHQTNKDWSVFSQTTDDGLMCYVRSTAKDKSPHAVDHGDVMFFVTRWKSDPKAAQPSLMVGYTMKKAPPPRARVGTTKITMFSDGTEAFIEEAADEKKLINAMRKGARLRVSAMSTRGTATAYEFSLSGITAALKKAEQLCR